MKPDHFVIGVDDDYIAEGQHATLEAAIEAADVMWLTPQHVEPRRAPWKVDIEARDAQGATLWVETLHEDDEPYLTDERCDGLGRSVCGVDMPHPEHWVEVYG